MLIIKSKFILTEKGFFDGYLVLENDKIKDIKKTIGKKEKFIDHSNDYVIPGIIDIHTHGAGGYPFINNTVEDVKNGCDFHLKHGTTSIIPTITAGPMANMKKALINIIKCKEQKLTKSNILGAHLEGPYLSKARCGAQCPAFIIKPNKKQYEPLVKEYGKYILRWTYAPENDKNYEFTTFLAKHNITPSIGHSDAEYEQVNEAYKRGANMITHLYCCTSTIKRTMGYRTLGVIESAYLLDDMYAEVITDGKHLPNELIRLVIKDKGIDRVIGCSDSLEIAGTDIKEGLMSGTPFIVEDGVCKLKDRSAFAGSVVTGDMMLRVLRNEIKLPLEDCVKLLSTNAAKFYKLNKGIIKKGYDADVLVVTKKLDLSKVIVNGEII